MWRVALKIYSLSRMWFSFCMKDHTKELKLRYIHSMESTQNLPTEVGKFESEKPKVSQITVLLHRVEIDSKEPLQQTYYSLFPIRDVYEYHTLPCDYSLYISLSSHSPTVVVVDVYRPDQFRRFDAVYSFSSDAFLTQTEYMKEGIEKEGKDGVLFAYCMLSNELRTKYAIESDVYPSCSLSIRFQRVGEKNEYSLRMIGELEDVTSILFNGREEIPPHNLPVRISRSQKLSTSRSSLSSIDYLVYIENQDPRITEIFKREWTGLNRYNNILRRHSVNGTEVWLLAIGNPRGYHDFNITRA
jgi:hypothetical protein